MNSNVLQSLWSAAERCFYFVTVMEVKFGIKFVSTVML